MQDIDAEYMKRLIAALLKFDTPRSLRALSFSLSPYVKPKPDIVVMRAHFYMPPTRDELEDISVLETELYSQTDLHTFDFTSEAQVAPIGTKLYPLEYMAWTDPTEAYRKG
jgi:hypothetical protein